MRFSHLAVIVMLVVASVFGCTKKDEAPAAKQVRVSATKAFEGYFGPAPTTDKGSCYAFVIYFPSAKEPGKVVPFPFFTFDEGSVKNVAVQRLLTGMADLKGYQGEILQPFPQGTRLLGLAEKEGVVTLNFTPELQNLKQDHRDALANALVLTVKQFSGVKDVRIQINGKESGLEKRAGGGGEGAVVPLSQPRLLSVTAVKDKGAKDVEAVNAYFDRPVDIKSLQMTGADGKPFKGEIYQSVFDMAGVLKPAEPGIFKVGMPIKVRWNVTDKMGRNAAGESEIPLEVQEH